jgi:hypothetical protein
MFQNSIGYLGKTLDIRRVQSTMPMDSHQQACQHSIAFAVTGSKKQTT